MRFAGSHRFRFSAWLIAAVAVAGLSRNALASTYVVPVPIGSSIYEELDTLDSLGYLDTYLSTVKPISRVEAARLALEAETNLREASRPEPLARALLRALNIQLREEIGWLENNAEDDQPTMIHPVERFKLDYVFSRGQRRRFRTPDRPGGIHATEGTPLYANNDGLPTGAGGNEVARLSAWAGVGSFLTFYGEGALAGPLTRRAPGEARFRLLGSGVVMSAGNTAISFGTEEMRWGTGRFGALSQGNNAQPFPALAVSNIHPIILGGPLRYLGQFRYRVFFGELDGARKFSHPWINGQVLSFKPLPNFEIGFTHTVIFGGRTNDSYGFGGFLGRFTGLSTGSSLISNTNSRGGLFFKFRIPALRNMQFYQEVLGEDNLKKEVPLIGGALPFLKASYQGGFYVPRLTADGLTDLRFEYAILDPHYSTHGDTLFSTYEGAIMGHPLGPNASRVDLQMSRWFDLRYKVGLDVFYSERAPSLLDDTKVGDAKERSIGIGLEMLRLAQNLEGSWGGLAGTHARLSLEYVSAVNYQPDQNSLRAMFSLSLSFSPSFGGWKWQ